MKRGGFLISLIVAVVLGSAIGGALAGGVAIGKSQGRQEAQQTLLSQLSQYASLGRQGNTQSQGNNTTGTISGLGATIGTVEKVQSNVITLRTTTGSTILVNVGNSTSILKTTEGSLADISSGDTITVSGSANADGSIQARRITIASGFTLPSLFGGQGQSQ